MVLYSCKIPLCKLSNVQTTDRNAIFRHYITHLQSQLEDLALDYGIPVTSENKYSIINLLIPFSKNEVLQKMMFEYCAECGCTEQSFESYYKKMRCNSCGCTVFLRGFRCWKLIVNHVCVVIVMTVKI